MAEIEVEGLGVVSIAGDEPTPEEAAAIKQALNRTPDFSGIPAPSTLARGQIDYQNVLRVRQEQMKFLRRLKPGPEDYRNSLIALSSMGAAAGAAALQPEISLPLLALAGGLGAAQGSLGAEVVGLDPSQTTGEAYRRAIGEARLDVATFGLASRAGPWWRGFRRRITNVKEAIASLAERYGVRLALEDVSGSRAITGIRNVVGQFPFFTGAFRKASIRKARDLDRALIEMVDDISPTASVLSDPKLGEELVRFAKTERYEHFTDISNALYRRFRKAAVREGAMVPTALTRARLREIVHGRLKLERVEEIAGKYVKKAAKLPEEKAVSFAKRLIEGLPDEIDIRTYEKLAKRMNKQIRQWRQLGLVEDADQLWAAKQALDYDLLNVQGGEASQRLVRLAHQFFHDGRLPFETAQAQIFGRVNKNVFSFGFEEPGRRNADEFLADVLKEITSPQSVRNMRKLVGDKNMNRVAQRFIEKRILAQNTLAINPETGRVGLNLNAIRRNLGLGNPKSQAYQTTRELLAGTKVAMRDVENFFDLAETVMRSPVVDFSKFIARRATLGGARSGIKGIVPVLSDEKVPLGRKLVQASVALFTFFRISDFVTNPAALKLARKAIEPTTEEAIRIGALVRLGEIIPERPESEITAMAEIAMMAPLLLGGRPAGLGRGAAVTRRLFRNPMEAVGLAALRQTADRLSPLLSGQESQEESR